MKTKAIFAAVLAGGATGAIGQQEEFSLTLVASSSTFECNGGTFTVSVFGGANVGTHYLGGGFGLDSSGGSSVITDITWTPAEWSTFDTDNGYAGGGVHNQVIFGQLVIPGIFPPGPGSEFGSLIGSFEIAYDSSGPAFFDIDLVPNDVLTLQTVDAKTGTIFTADETTLTIHGASVLICPAPGTTVAFGSLGLIASRRRRSRCTCIDWSLI